MTKKEAKAIADILDWAHNAVMKGRVEAEHIVPIIAGLLNSELGVTKIAGLLDEVAATS